MRCTFSVIAAAALVPGLLAATASADEHDPRIGLGAGWLDAEEASSNMELLSHSDKPTGFVNPSSPGALGFANSDLAFGGGHAYVGNFRGFLVYDLADPAEPVLTTTVLCPASSGQSDVTYYEGLLFVSVENGGRVDCSTDSSQTLFRGVRIFDVSDVSNPVQVAAVQTCRGSHTHTLVTDPNDPDNVYIYNSGIAGVRSAAQLEGCTNTPGGNNPDAFLDEDGNPIFTSRFMVEVIKVPLAAPETAEVVNEARLMEDFETGNQHGLWPGGNHGPGTQSTTATDACHDITAYPEVGLAAGACEGNGILIDISDPADPVRVDEVIDPNFAYWHSATFNNDGTKVVFTDEWGGGTSARCRPTDPVNWGANAIFDIVDGKMELASYYKLPVPQTNQENCVAHNGSIVPVPGRDIMVQAWYQGGISVYDFTDSASPTEIAYFDRGPMHPTSLQPSGFWSAYYYNGLVYGSEIGRGFDTFALTESDDLARAELDVAALVEFDDFNPQHQPRADWASSFEFVRAKFAQALRTDTMSEDAVREVGDKIDRAERFADGPQRRAAVAQLRAATNQLDDSVQRQAELSEALDDLADELS